MYLYGEESSVWAAHRDLRVEAQSLKEMRVTSGVPQGRVLGQLLLLAYVNYIWRNIESTIRLFADDCIIYRKIINNNSVA
jgi:hypothetical protein